MPREEIKCPKCGSPARKESSLNPIRNVMREYVYCKKCGYEHLKEYPA